MRTKLIVSGIVGGLVCVIVTISFVTINIKLDNLKNIISHQNTIIAAQSQRISGEHRDLVTCGDLQSLITQGYIAYYSIDSYYNLNSSPAQLPKHCINP